MDIIEGQQLLGAMQSPIGRPEALGMADKAQPRPARGLSSIGPHSSKQITAPPSGQRS